jgi:tRNA uridine 5-carboxymethylaminomethyl modification enzyme
MKSYVESLPNVSIRQGMVKTFLTENGQICGVELGFGERIAAKAVVLCAGTFLEGTIWIGKETQPAGRAGEFPAHGLSSCLKSMGFTMGRLKTGTPPRIDGRTIDYSHLLEVPGDSVPTFFSFLDKRPILPQLSCHQTRTTAVTHEVILNNLNESPMYSGMIHGIGPRYCPSIEDKVVRFADKDSHSLFLEPEGRSTYEVYLQGCSTSLPVSVQLQIVKSLPGLENAVMIRPAYAVEYDYLPAIQFEHSLMSKDLQGFFAAGQMLGTSGYEEAAGQGIVAGINAALYVLGKEPLVLSRSSSYIGTLIDDLVSKEINEPYRMMTSRSEYRLLLRQDNADQRLTPIGRSVGMVDDYRYNLFEAKQEAMNAEKTRLKKTRIFPAVDVDATLLPYGEVVKQVISLEELLRRPRIPYSVIEKLSPASENEQFAHSLEVETDIKYQGYIDRQMQQVAQTEKLEAVKLPQNTDYFQLENLSKEAREKLNKIRPATLGQASRIAGVSPADVSVLMVYLESQRRKNRQVNQSASGESVSNASSVPAALSVK